MLFYRLRYPNTGMIFIIYFIFKHYRFKNYVLT